MKSKPTQKMGHPHLQGTNRKTAEGKRVIEKQPSIDEWEKTHSQKTWKQPQSWSILVKTENTRGGKREINTKITQDKTYLVLAPEQPHKHGQGALLDDVGRVAAGARGDVREGPGGLELQGGQVVPPQELDELGHDLSVDHLLDGGFPFCGRGSRNVSPGTAKGRARKTSQQNDSTK